MVNDQPVQLSSWAKPTYWHSTSLDLLLGWLEKGQKISSQMMIEWWFTMVESVKKQHLNKRKFMIIPIWMGVCHPLFAAKSHKVIWSRNHVEDGHCLSDLVNFNMHQRCCRNSATFLDTPISAGNRRKHHLPSTCTFLRSMFEYFTKVYKVLKNLRTTVKCHVKSWFTYTDIIHAVWNTIFHIETVPFQLTFGHSRGSIQSQMHHLWNFWTYV